MAVFDLGATYTAAALLLSLMSTRAAKLHATHAIYLAAAPPSAAGRSRLILSSIDSE
jgi:hypothetical protein